MSPRLKQNLWLLCGLLIGILLIFYAVAGLSKAQTCDTTSLPVVVNLDNEKNIDTIAHASGSVISGQPRILHIDRVNAAAHRRASLRRFPTRPGFDRDEYPPASSTEGGPGADISYVVSADNRSAGARMSIQLRPYCEGQAFILEPGTP